MKLITEQSRQEEMITRTEVKILLMGLHQQIFISRKKNLLCIFSVQRETNERNR